MAETFGRGAMTNHWTDVRNSDVIMVIGANPAENHPASFGHITEAKDRGAKLISVDPRFTRTSAKADIYSQLRSGTDVAFIGGMIKYVTDDMDANPGNYNMTYVSRYTNAGFLINSDFKGAVDLDGVFSGYDEDARSYNKSTWSYQTDANGIPKQDYTLQDPNCVFQLLKKQYARYTPKMVSDVTGANEDTFLEICRTYAASGAVGKAGTIMYAMGTTQHTNGTQMIRSYAMLQLLLGNIGVTGGGINALRGESNVQGSTDHCLLWHILPGYIGQPRDSHTTIDSFMSTKGPTRDPKSANWWGYYSAKPEDDDPWKSNYSKYVVSLLKAWYGNAATSSNQFAYHNLPKADAGKDYSWISLFNEIDQGTVKGLMAWGQNAAVCGPNAGVARKAMEKLDWLVVADLWETETAAFWKRPGASSSSIQTEVFLLPAACSYEKEGSVTNSGRWMQWRWKAVDPPGDANHDLWIINQLMSRVRDLYNSEGGENPKSITDLTWDYGEDPDASEVAKEINGYNQETGKLMVSFGALKNDGTTSSGNWLYCNSYVEPENLDAFEKAHPEMYPGEEYIGNRSTRRWADVGAGGYGIADGYKEVGLRNYWAWTWPVNRRIIYNRASVDLQGKPWDAEHPVIEFKGTVEDGKYTGGSWKGDVPDGGWKPIQNPDGTERDDTRWPFIMKPEGHARIFGAGRADGPFPEHYEPWESPVDNLLSGQQNDPAFKIWGGDYNKKGDVSQFPIVCTTFRLVEHWQSGQMTRNQPWLVEMMPECFIEISHELAGEKGIQTGDDVKVSSARGEITVKAQVTKRLKPYNLGAGTVHQVALPWHWGYVGLSTGDSA
ncbi:MAG: molybdopterin-dependent oxidoreductase, partial [Dehalococcoidales bacterium]